MAEERIQGRLVAILVADARGVLPETYEQIGHRLMDESQYRDFMFANAVRLHGGMNPDFFKATVIECDAAKQQNC
ncbi:MAG: hypothetical protein HQ514_15620 [Rhodospirillales bacterium]|nr:hypothetical protein [Rhodospirillales bacterium]